MRTITEIQADIDGANNKIEDYEENAAHLKSEADRAREINNLIGTIKSGLEAEKKLAEQGIIWRFTEPGAI